MIHRIGRAAVLSVALVALGVGATLAHESRAVGDHTFAVGFIDEPVFTGQKSGLEFFVSHGEEGPVEGLEETLQAEVTFGGDTRALEISPQACRKRALQSGWDACTRQFESNLAANAPQAVPDTVMSPAA